MDLVRRMWHECLVIRAGRDLGRIVVDGTSVITDLSGTLRGGGPGRDLGRIVVDGTSVSTDPSGTLRGGGRGHGPGRDRGADDPSRLLQGTLTFHAWYYKAS